MLEINYTFIILKAEFQTTAINVRSILKKWKKIVSQILKFGTQRKVILRRQ